MIDLTKYPEINKRKREKKLVEKECNKQFAMEKKENPDITVERLIEINQKIDDFNNSAFAKTIFEIMKKINPKVLEYRTGEILNYLDVFGDSFDNLPEYMKAEVYQMTYEAPNGYNFVEDIQLGKNEIESGKIKIESFPVGFEKPIFRNGQILDGGYMFGLSRQDRISKSKEEKNKHYEKWDYWSDYERADFMNKTYGMNYNLDDFAKERRD